MAHIDGYSDFLVEDVRVKLGYDAKDSSHDDEVLAKLTAGEKISKSKHLKQPKYKAGQKLMETDTLDLTFTILTVSPKVDFENQHNYFIEVEQDNGDIWYVVHEEQWLDQWFEVLE